MHNQVCSMSRGPNPSDAHTHWPLSPPGPVITPSKPFRLKEAPNLARSLVKDGIDWHEGLSTTSGARTLAAVDVSTSTWQHRRDGCARFICL